MHYLTGVDGVHGRNLPLEEVLSVLEREFDDAEQEYEQA